MYQRVKEMKREKPNTSEEEVKVTISTDTVSEQAAINNVPAVRGSVRPGAKRFR